MPTRIYTDIVIRLIKRFDIKQIAHITGGGFPLKAVKGLPEKIGMVIDKSSWPVPEEFLELKARARISEKQMFSTFNMGIGMTMVVNKKDAQSAITDIRKEFKVKAYIIGHLEKSNEKIRFI